MDGELLIVPGTSMPQMIQPAASLDGGDDHPKRKRAKRWFKEWVPQETVLSTGKCRLLKWINDDTMSLMKTKHLDQEADLDYEVVYVCTFENCGKVFTEAPALRKHAHVHGEKQFICHYEGCGKRFVDSSKLKRHFLIHTGEKHFLCKFCGKAFSLDFNLRSHMRTHTGENYHTCPYEDCGKRYAHEYKLRGHLKTHHDKLLPDGKQVPMSLDADQHSSRSSPASASAAAAAAAAGNSRPFACPYKGCDKRYFYEYKLNLHLKKGHVKDEMVEQNGSDEFSDGSEQEHLSVRGPSGKGKLRIANPKTAAAPSRAKRKKPAAAASSGGGGGGGGEGQQRTQQPVAVAVAGRKVVIKHDMQEDSEETEDEGRDDIMDEEGGAGHEVVYEDDEETEDDMD